MKGFIEIIGMFATIIAATLLLSTNTQLAQYNSTQVDQTALLIEQYSINMQKVSFHCNWENEVLLRNCINIKSSELLTKIGQDNYSCVSTISRVSLSQTEREVVLELTCQKIIKTNNSTQISFAKQVKLTKNKALDGLVLWNKMDNDMKDYSGNLNNPTIFSTTNTTGVNEGTNSAKLFTSEMHYARYAQNTSLNTQNAITISVWVNTQDNRTQPIVEYGNFSTIGVNLGLYDTGSKAYVNFVDTSGVSHELMSQSGLIVPNKWQQIAATYDGTKRALYIDGQKVVEQNFDSFILKTNLDLYIAKRPSNANVDPNIKIDELMIWNKALTPEDINYIYNAQKS